MWADVTDLNEFYRSRLGQVARRLITRRLRELWPNVRGLSVLGLGYATPYLRAFREEAERVMAVMPAQQGVLHWPDNDPCLVCLSEEIELPLPDLSVDRLLLVHAVESTEQLRAMMREAWRVLSDSGRLIVVVPNRRSIWARFEHTPFGNGHPYSANQINRILRGSMFTPMRSAVCLYIPPTRRRFWLSTAPAWENIGARWFSPLGGVTLVEATKQIYGGVPVGAPARVRRYVTVGASAGGG
jgi:SAM-dependent methyltransferase